MIITYNRKEELLRALNSCLKNWKEYLEVVIEMCIRDSLSILLYRKEQKDGFECIPFAHLNLVYAEELLFFAFFLMWTYFAGFHPAAYGTERCV